MLIRSLFFLILGWGPVAGAASLPSGGGSSITISAVGDIMMGTNYPSDTLPSDEGRSLFRHAAEYIRASDIRFGNFEGTFLDGEKGADGKRGGPNRYLFRTPTRYVERLQEAGFNVMSLANNHIKDMGKVGIVSTKETLKRAGIRYSSKDGEVATFEIQGIKVALIAGDYYRGGRSMVQPGPFLDEIRKLKERFHVVIVSLHAGGEGGSADRVRPGREVFLGEDRGDSIGFARSAVDVGADLVLMHGPHVPRGLEIYRERLIAYSLGNFATGRGISIAGKAGLAPVLRVKMDASGRFLQGHIASFRQDRSKGTYFDPKESAFVLIKSLSELDFPNSMPRFSSNGFFGPAKAGGLP